MGAPWGCPGDALGMPWGRPDTWAPGRGWWLPDTWVPVGSPRHLSGGSMTPGSPVGVGVSERSRCPRRAPGSRPRRSPGAADGGWCRGPGAVLAGRGGGSHGGGHGLRAAGAAAAPRRRRRRTCSAVAAGAEQLRRWLPLHTGVLPRGHRLRVPGAGGPWGGGSQVLNSWGCRVPSLGWVGAWMP